jgi:hypothetical protein
MAGSTHTHLRLKGKTMTENTQVTPLTAEEEAQLNELLERKQAADAAATAAAVEAALATIEPVRAIVETPSWGETIAALKATIGTVPNLSLTQAVGNAVTVMENLSRQTELRVQQISAGAVA